MSNSVGRLVNALADHERRAGNTVYVVVGYGADSEADYVMETRAGYLSNVLDARLRDNDGFGAERSTRKMIQRLEAMHPDVVHIHNIHGYYLNMTILIDALARMDVAVVITLHDWWLLTGHCASVTKTCIDDNLRVNCDTCVETFKHRYPASYRHGDVAGHQRLKHDLLTSLARRVIVAPTERLASAMRAAGYDNVVTIAHGTDISNAGLERQRLSDDGKIRVLSVSAKWSSTKNIAALKNLARQLPDDMSLTIVGQHGESLPPSVSVVPRVDSREEMKALYAKADVLVSPSLCESFGMSVAEAITLKLPVVVQRHSGTDEIVGENDGVIADCNDTAELIKAIRRAATMTPTTTFDLHAMLDSYHKLYLQC